jgi:hypothetical protein
MNQDTIQYAIENTLSLSAPRQVRGSYDPVILHFRLITQNMDQPNLNYLREGRIVAHTPLTVPADPNIRVTGTKEETTQDFLNLIEKAAHHCHVFPSLRIEIGEITKKEIQQDSQDFTAKAMAEEKDRQAHDDQSVLIAGIEESWEICLLKATLEIMSKSSWNYIQEHLTAEMEAKNV